MSYPQFRRLTRGTTCFLAAAGLLLLFGCAAGGALLTDPQVSSAGTAAAAQKTLAQARQPAQESPLVQVVSQRISTYPTLQVRPPELIAGNAAADQEPLPLIAQDVSVVITGHRVRVVMDLVFLNPGSEPRTATLRAALPDRAGLSYIGLFTGRGVDISGPVDPARLPLLLNPQHASPELLLSPEPSLQHSWQAETIELNWDTLTSAMIVEPIQQQKLYEAPAHRFTEQELKTWAGGAGFSARIPTIPPLGFRRVVYAYDQTLIPTEGQILFPLPLLAEEVGNSRIVVHDVSGTLVNSTVKQSREPLPAQRTEYGLYWVIKPKAGETGLFQAELRDPEISALVGRDPDISTSLVSLSVTPNLIRQAAKAPTGKALFVLDTSYSSRETFLRLSGQLLRNILNSDDSLQSFALLCFDVRPTLLTPGFVPNTIESRRHYLGLIEQIWLDGATDFESVLQYLEVQPELLQADTCFLLSDGEISWGVDDPERLSTRFSELMEKRWICYTFGPAQYNRPLFETLTHNGRIVHAAQGQDLLETARAHRYPMHRLNAVFTALNDEVVVSGDPKLLYPGQVLEIAVRRRRPGPSIRLVVQIDGRNMERIIPLRGNPISDYLGARAWAEIYVSRLLKEPDDSAIQAVYALSKHFNLSNDFASFFLMESDQAYQRYGLLRRSRRMDFSRVLLLLRDRLIARRQVRPDSGLLLPEDLKPKAADIVESIGTLQPVPVWRVAPALPLDWNPQLLTGETVDHIQDNADALYLTAGLLIEQARMLHQTEVPGKENPRIAAARALRVLSTMAELGPRDSRGLSLLGFVLLEWGLYAEAERVFSTVRRIRPFEPQNLLLETIAQTAQEKLKDAAFRYEILLQRSFPRFNNSLIPVVRRLYSDLLQAVLSSYPDHADRELWIARLEELGAPASPEEQESAEPPARLLLFWNLDDCDMDLHVQENRSTEIWYQNTSSRSGGRLFGDNTIGLGPELYEHPRLSRRGFRVSVNYYSSSLPDPLPAAALAAVFSAPKGAPPSAAWHTALCFVPGQKVTILPAWKRVKRE